LDLRFFGVPAFVASPEGVKNLLWNVPATWPTAFGSPFGKFQ